jgi:hypothetical protein
MVSTVDDVQAPLVSVIIPTYNYSSVLKYAVQTVLWQTFEDFELLVMGDGCTDDSEAVVAAFGDARVQWHNLPENSGSQSMPNNTGIERARGKYIAYLGHDDLWRPNHLQALVDVMDSSGADLAHTLLMMIFPESPRHRLYGVFGADGYQPPFQVPPPCLMHLRAMVEDTGGWKDYRAVRIPYDIEFVSRAVMMGKRIVCAEELTVFKFPSGVRKNVYVEKPSFEQAEYIERMQHEPDFLYLELLAAVMESDEARQALQINLTFPSTLKPGEIVENWRTFRGLEAKATVEAPSLLDDPVTLMAFNPMGDITPAASQETLHGDKRLPENGVLLGAGWYGLERDGQGRAFRWVNTNAEILLTERAAAARRLTMNVWLGYANDGQPVTLALVDADGATLGEVVVQGEQEAVFELPERGGTATFQLRVSGSRNQPLANDPRILNVGVRRVEVE